MATVDTTYFVVCWKYFLGIFIVVVTAAASAKEKKIQLTQTKKQLLTRSIWLTAKRRQLQQQSLKTWKRGTKTTGTNISTTVTKMGKNANLVNVSMTHLQNVKGYLEIQCCIL